MPNCVLQRKGNKMKTNPDKEKQTEGTTQQQSRRERVARFIGLVLNGKFFPREIFAAYWGVLLTLVTLFVASIAHRNMYMLQQNQIKLLERELEDRCSVRVLLEYERDENLRLHEISEAVERHNIPLEHSPEPKVLIVVPNVVEEEPYEK